MLWRVPRGWQSAPGVWVGLPAACLERSYTPVVSETPDFPNDLLELQVAWYEASAELRVIPLRPWTDATGTEHRSDSGWCPDHEEQEQRVRGRLLEVSEGLVTHPFWSSLPAGTVAAARARLKQTARPVGRAVAGDG